VLEVAERVTSDVASLIVIGLAVRSLISKISQRRWLILPAQAR
jgi:hypothetical protein